VPPFSTGIGRALIRLQRLFTHEMAAPGTLRGHDVVDGGESEEASMHPAPLPTCTE
jgi:hypothetical protein